MAQHAFSSCIRALCAAGSKGSASDAAPAAFRKSAKYRRRRFDSQKRCGDPPMAVSHILCARTPEALWRHLTNEKPPETRPMESNLATLLSGRALSGTCSITTEQY